jgi:phosphohistidine phosphatase
VKTLYIVRHAKSSWENPLLADFDRPLNERGKRDAPRMAKRLKEKRITPDLMLSSPAKRALSTCKQMAEVLGYNKDKIKTNPDLYHSDEDEILRVIRTIKDHHQTAFIFGHNPGLTEFVNAISEANIDNVPTCGIVACTFETDSWGKIDWGSGTVLFYDYPKNKIQH